ncbi:MAG: trypsin-like peptidase domain-containing protein [Candidatus Izemoplasmatales bacterium]|nr:trypsin-like peptidase domain-containing protein [Candidatus Izemoplasmatales bacterium]
MKKIFAFLFVFVLVSLTVGCAGLFDPVEETSRTFLTRPPVPTTENTINEDLIISDLYQRIYESLYDEVKQEVINDISEERFQQLYDSVIQTIMQDIESGEITLTAANVVDMILSLEAQQAKTVVGIRNKNANGVIQAVGSGVIYKQVGDRYYVLTNNHVIEDGISFSVVFEDGEETGAVLRGVDELVDLAVLYFTSEEDLPVAEFGDSDAINKGEIVVAVGHPSGFGYFGSMTMGIISGKNRYFDIDGDSVKDMFVGYLQHDAAINSGNSGGALFDLDGKLIGVNVIKISSVTVEGMGFAIPSNLVQAIVTDIEEFGYSIQKPILGIRFIDIKNNQSFFEQNEITLPVGLTTGFYIIEVDEGKTMDGYLLPGDILIEIGDVIVESSTQFVEEFSKYRVGDIIDVVIIRNNQTMTITDIELKAAK